MAKLLKGIDLVGLAEEHRRRDQLVTGAYAYMDPRSPAFRGCSVGCLAESVVRRWDGMAPHAALHQATGVPIWWWWVQDQVFEWGGGGDWHVDAAVAVVGVQDWKKAGWLCVGKMMALVVEGEWNVANVAAAASAASDYALWMAGERDSEKPDEPRIPETAISSHVRAADRNALSSAAEWVRFGFPVDFHLLRGALIVTPRRGGGDWLKLVRAAALESLTAAA